MKTDPRKVIDARLWAIVAATVRPLPGRVSVSPETDFHGPPGVRPPSAPPVKVSAAPLSSRPAAAGEAVPQPIEPGRYRRLARGRVESMPTIDLHGLDQDGARRILTNFVLRAHADGARTLLVITGKGVQGDGVLRRRTPEWLAEPPLRAVIAGLSEARRQHGGEGALYIALRRRTLQGG